tara:strand:+ start:1521 stop:2411 length:891 start_codon:yes stop_codon:yes gene_type:complete
MKQNKSLLNISDLSRNDILDIFKYSLDLDKEQTLLLKNKSIGLIFEKYSTRTRLSFQVGINQLGGNAIDIKFDELNLQRIESLEDTFKIFELYLDALVFRTNDHTKLNMAYKYFNKPIINALSDLSHPCQIIADFFTINQIFNTLDDISICWFGDMNNVLYSYFEFLVLFPNINLNVFTNENIFKKNNLNFPKSKNINFYFNLDNTVISTADVIMTDVFTSMNDVKNNKEILLKNFQVNMDLINLTKNDCIFMHCLPANIGVEVTHDVLLNPKSKVMIQAKNRLIAQRGILQWLKI